VFIAKSVMFTFLSLSLVPLIFIASRLNLLTFLSKFSTRHRLPILFPRMTHWPNDQLALLSTEP